jgi:hypothetical protein
VKNVEWIEGDTLAPLDIWDREITTAAYASQEFDCLPGTPGPVPEAVTPDEGAPGATLTIQIAGENFVAGTTAVFDSDVAVVGPPVLISGNLLMAQVEISQAASTGFRSLTLANPDGSETTLENAFEIKQKPVPTIEILEPEEGAVLEGLVTVMASVGDDARPDAVEFRLDGSLAYADELYPYRWEWDTLSASDGAHTVEATVVSSAGTTATDSTSVTVDNFQLPGDCDGDGTVSIGEVQRVIRMHLHLDVPGCGADCDGSGSISIGELQKVINAHLRLPSSC